MSCHRSLRPHRDNPSVSHFMTCLPPHTHTHTHTHTQTHTLSLTCSIIGLIFPSHSWSCCAPGIWIEPLWGAIFIEVTSQITPQSPHKAHTYPHRYTVIKTHTQSIDPETSSLWWAYLHVLLLHSLLLQQLPIRQKFGLNAMRTLLCKGCDRTLAWETVKPVVWGICMFVFYFSPGTQTNFESKRRRKRKSVGGQAPLGKPVHVAKCRYTAYRTCSAVYVVCVII